MLYDVAGQGVIFYLCNVDAKIRLSAVGAILHIKRGEYICICTSFCNAINHIITIINHIVAHLFFLTFLDIFQHLQMKQF